MPAMLSKSKRQTGDESVSALTVVLSQAQLSALSVVSVVVTSAVDVAVVNAAGAAYRLIREAAARHPRSEERL